MIARSIRMRTPSVQGRAKLSVAAFFLCIGFLTTAYCQETGALKGTVEDSTGAAVIGAHVALKDNATGKQFSEVTDEDGYFQVGQLPVGQYVLTVEAPGFETWEKTIEVGTKPASAILIRMKLQQFKQEVTVKAEAESAPTALDNRDYLELDQTALQHMPIKEGDPLAIPSLFLEPAVMGSQGPQLIVDGVEESTLELPTSAIKEIYVNKSPYSAEFGRPGKGRIEVITRQGSRHHYRGNVSFILRNSAFDARNAFASTRPLMQRPIGEAQLSGPLSNKVSFFIAGRYVHRNQAAVIDAVTPAGNLVENFPVHGVDAHGFGRLDFKLSNRNQLTLSYKYKDKSRQNQTVGGFDLPSRATDTLDRENEVRVFETATVSEGLLNEVRFTYKKQSISKASVSSDTAIIVLDSFNSGGAQQSQTQTEQVGVAQDTVTAVKGNHTLRFGLAARPRYFDALDETNFGGTYMFSSLAAYAASTQGSCVVPPPQPQPSVCPYVFTQNQGNPSVSYHQIEYSSFIQDEARLGSSLSLSFGARYEFQSKLDYYKNVAPRAALAFAPGRGRTVIRAGGGLFYDRLPDVMQEQSLLYDGVHILQVVLQNPPYPVPFPAGQPPFDTPSVIQIAPGIRTPCLFQANLSIDQKLGKGRNYLTLDYTTVRGFRLYRTRNINAPLPPAFSQRPNPNFINIDQFESSGSSKSNILTTTLKTSPHPRFYLMAQYTYSHTIDDTSGMFSLPANNYDLRAERGRSDLDRRHRLNLMASYGLPLAFRFGTVVVLNSGIPYNITTGVDTNNDTVANDRPPGVDRNTGRGPGFAQVDVHLSRPFHFEKNKHRPRVELGVDAFNVMNTVNYKDYIGTLTSPFFGRANAANPPREVQLSLQLYF
jgi:Carboxypeptidase regulatory-like domain